MTPTTVILTIDEGNGQRAEIELFYPTRFQAEQFVYLLPYLMTVGQWDNVRDAIISPMVEGGKGLVNDNRIGSG